MQVYSDPSRANDPHALPNIEVWYNHPDGKSELERGWYWWACFPGCLPDSYPTGPFPTADAALANAQEDGAGAEDY